MTSKTHFRRRALRWLGVALILAVCGMIAALPSAAAYLGLDSGAARAAQRSPFAAWEPEASSLLTLDSGGLQDYLVQAAEAALAAPQPLAPNAACSGGPTIDGILLDECIVDNFTVNGEAKSITVWYTKNQITATRQIDGNPVVMSHWINTDAQAVQVGNWGQQAWERFYTIFGRHPYDKGCNNNINVRMEQGVGWSGIAYWASNGNCWIGIDSGMVRSGGGQWTVYHEFQHYLQYSFDDGCYSWLKANYKDGKAEGNAEFVEGYADLGADAVDSALDAIGYGGAGYNPATSLYSKSYGNLYNKYFAEQLGTLYAPTDPHFHMDAVSAHYHACDDKDTLYVLDTLIPSLKSGESEESFFLDFFAANWAKDWADPATQPELTYWDDDGNPYSSVSLAQNVAISTGSQSWNGEVTPDDWAGRYYQVRPQAGCNFVTARVDGAAGAKIGINLMAADTTAPTSVERSAWIGNEFARTFAGAGVHDRIVAAVNSFADTYSYDVSFTCVSPVLDILEPRQPKPALVGDPTSPIAFLARVTVKDGAQPVLGIVESQISAEAEGDPITVVPGSFQQVGEEYWMTLVPPVKPAGTTFVDLTICVSGSICDTETDALLYVAPGNTDFALVYDGSNSMNIEDVIGEGTRLVNAKKAGYVLADLLRAGDRILVTSFSGIDNPAGCGLPGGDGNCPLDIITHMARTNVAGPATIPNVRSAIDMITGRAWTPIGAGLVDAKNKLQAAPYGLNPKHIILLSDGEENVHPLWDEVDQEMIDSGVVVNTVAFSHEANQALMALIAASTGGTYRYVPTSPGTMAQSVDEQASYLASQGVPAALIERSVAAFLPGPLALDDAYEYFETKGQSASRLLHAVYTEVPDFTNRTVTQYVEPNANILRWVVASKQPDFNGCSSSYRSVEILPPGADQRDGWIQVSPPGMLPAGWEVRNSTYDDVIIITNPASGLWRLRTQHGYCIGAQEDGEAAPEAALAPNAGPYDVMINASIQANVQLDGRFLSPIVNNQGKAGDVVPIVATLMDKTGTFPLPGTFPAQRGVYALIERPGGATDFTWLFDDGNHSDGAADDGIYGGLYGKTSAGGTYNVRLLAYWTENGQVNTREWNGGFWLLGPDANDADGDGLPDDWELACGLDISRDDSTEDFDRDGLTNMQEFLLGTIPCNSDSDHSGESDGSEVTGGYDPLYPDDDRVPPIGRLNALPLNEMIRLTWPNPISYTNVDIFVSTDPDQLGTSTEVASTGVYTLTGLTNDTTYYLTLRGKVGTVVGDYSPTVEATPKADPDAPSGAILINDGAERAASAQVELTISSTDEPLQGLAEAANGHAVGPLAEMYNQVSGNIEMRISNSPSLEGAPWEPLAFHKQWTLAGTTPGVYRVYAQFRDGAGNESFITYDDIILSGEIYAPILKK